MFGRTSAYLRLCRLPTVFTALADICAGYLLTHQTWTPPQQFVALLCASAGLYLSGMVLNDVFDRTVDLKERPNRPIPSGAVSVRAAIIFGSVLMLVGLGAAALVGLPSLATAGCAALAVLLYDGGLKKTVIGPLSMGSCRFFNILLGASGGAVEMGDVFALPQIWFATAMFVYITGVTWFARREAGDNRFLSLFAALLVVDLGLALLATWIVGLPGQWGWNMPAAGFDPPEMMLFFLAAIALTINRRASTALQQPVPKNVQMAVGLMLLSIISIDSMVIFFHRGPEGMPFAVATLSLIIPALILRRWIPLT